MYNKKDEDEQKRIHEIEQLMNLVKYGTKEKTLEELEKQKVEEEKRFILEKEAEEKKQKEEYKINNSPLYNYFGAIEGGETTLYYLRTKNKFGETRYKIGVTLNHVSQRYSNKYNYKILYEKKLTHANTIEKEIKKKFFHLITDESLLGTDGTEIFKEDVLKMDS